MTIVLFLAIIGPIEMNFTDDKVGIQIEQLFNLSYAQRAIVGIYIIDLNAVC